MKKTLSVVLAVVLALSMFASFAYVATPEKSNDYQLSLVSVKAVNVQDTAQGVRSYADLVDTTRIFQVNEVIFLAVTTEVKNLEKYPKLKSIEDKDITVILGSPSIDLSYAKLSSPTLLANVWSGASAVDVATIGYVAPAGAMLTYNKGANEIEWVFRGTSMYGMTGSSHNSAYMHLVTFDPEFKGDKIYIPAIKLRNKETSWVLGGQTFDTKYEAPDAIGYTMVITGVTKDNEGAQKGTFYAKLLISGAEKFEFDGDYYLIGPDGTYSNNKPAAPLKEWLDYVKISVHKLEIAGAYTVFKYYIPSSAVLNYTDFFYNGDATAINNGNDGTGTYADYALTIGRANPNLFDNATKFSNKMREDFLDVAGGVRSVKAYETYTSTKTIDVPLTSVVYTNNKMYYAPGFYGGKITWGGTVPGTPADEGTEYIKETYGVAGSRDVTNDTNVVENFQLALSDAEHLLFDASRIKVVASSAYIEAYSIQSPGTVAGTLDVFGNAKGAKGDASNTFDNGVTSDVVSPLIYNKLTSATWDGKTPTADFTTAANWDTNAAGSPVNRPYSRKGFFDVTDIFVDPLYGNSFQTVKSGNGWVVNLKVDSARLKSALGWDYVTPFDPNGQAGQQSLYVYYEAATDSAVPSGFTRADDIYVGAKNAAEYHNEDKFIVPMDANGKYFRRAGEKTGSSAITSSLEGLSYYNLTNEWGDSTHIDANLKDGKQLVNTLAEVHLDLKITDDTKGTWYLGIPFYDFSAGLPTEPSSTHTAVGPGYMSVVSAADGRTLNPTNTGAVKITDPALGKYGTTGIVDKVEYKHVYGFKSKDVVIENGKPVIVLNDFVHWTGTAWESLNPANLVGKGSYKALTGTINNPINAEFYDKLKNPYVVSVDMNAKFDYLKSLGTDAVAAPYYRYLDPNTAAPESIWETGSNSEVVDHNGIVMYSIQTYEDEIPVISIATERTYFTSDDGYGICLFDGTSNAFGSQYAGRRVYRSNDSNLAYSALATHVQDSSKKIAALQYFDLDTSFNTVWKVLDSAFESKGAAAVYSDTVNGEFNYGTIEIVPDPIEEGTEDEAMPTDDESTPDPVDETTDEPTDEIVDETTPEPEIEDETTPAPAENNSKPSTSTSVPRTGDVDANVAIALIAAAIVSAAGLAFVMKKVR